MAINKRKKLSTKEIKAIIAQNYKKAAYLFNDKKKVDKLLSVLEDYIEKNTTIIDSYDDIKMLITIIRDVSNDKFNGISPECIVSILSVLMHLEEQISISLESLDEDRKDILSYLQKNFKDDYKDYVEWEKWTKPGIYPMLPACIIDNKEDDSMISLANRYEKLIEPTLPARAVSKAKDLVPEVVQKQIEKLAASITDQELYTQIMNVIASGFDILVKNASKVSLSEDYIIEQINQTMDDNHIFTIDEVCYARSYDVAKLVNRFKTKNVFVAFAEGGITGMAGLPGIPANIAASMFIFYRAIQSIAMYYGYDVKNNADELQIATDVFMQALSPATGSTSETGDMIVKFMSMTEALVVKDTIKGGWKAMADRGGICLLITQIRSLAHKSAEKALNAASQKSLEKTMFTGFFEQLGKKMTQESVKKAATPLAALITAFADMSTMNKVIEFADIFYNKRFITEKQIRIDSLINPEIIENVNFDVIDEE